MIYQKGNVYLKYQDLRTKIQLTLLHVFRSEMPLTVRKELGLIYTAK